MQGIYINGRRPKSKTEVRKAVAEGLNVRVEATSIFGNEYDGPVEGLPEGSTVTFTGPDPYTSRRFYGTIKKRGDKVTVS